MSFWDDSGPIEEGYVRKLSSLEMLRRILPRLRPHRRTLGFAVVLMLASVGAELASPLLLRRLIDRDLSIAVDTGRVEGILTTAGMYLAVFLIGSWSSYRQILMVARMGLAVVTRLKQDLFAHTLNLGMDYFDHNPPGRLLARVESDSERLQILFSEVALAILRVLLLMVGMLTIMFMANWRITLLLLAIVSPMMFAGLFVIRYVRRMSAIVRRLYARLTTFVTEYVQAVPILQVFGRTGWSMEKLHRVNRQRYVAETKAGFLEYGFSGYFLALEVVAVMAILWLGFGSRVGKLMTLGTLVLFIEYTRRLFWPILMFTEQLNFLQRAFASADRVFGILATESKVVDPPDVLTRIPEDWREIAFENVTFAYEGGGKPALEGVSFVVRRGERIALAGPSGGGKTTATNLLLRFYEPTSGRITLDGVDIRRYSLKAWRSGIGLVLQDIHLFPGTVADNLRVFTDEISEESLLRAVHAIGAEDTLERLPHGLATNLAEGGQNLSMGERQLISFSRAVVRDPEILVLDEATSSVDPGTERRLQDSLHRLLARRTSLVVAHRLSTITSADRILVLQRGRLIEEGTHAQLYRSGGLYRGLFDLQFNAGEVV